MQLYASATSPYARKVRIALIELGLDSAVTVVATQPTEDTSFRRINPLGKIPALRRDDGLVLYDSLVIVEYLDQLAGGGRLIPADPDARIKALRFHALADGILDAAFCAVMELRRPAPQRSAFWLERWLAAIAAGFTELGAAPPAGFGLAAITTAVAIDYVAFRLGDQGIELGALAGWRAALGDRVGLSATHPGRELI